MFNFFYSNENFKKGVEIIIYDEIIFVRENMVISYNLVKTGIENLIRFLLLSRVVTYTFNEIDANFLNYNENNFIFGLK